MDLNVGTYCDEANDRAHCLIAKNLRHNLIYFFCIRDVALIGLMNVEVKKHNFYQKLGSYLGLDTELLSHIFDDLRGVFGAPVSMRDQQHATEIAGLSNAPINNGDISA